MSNYGERKSRAVGLSDKAFGGAGMNLSLDAIMGEGDMITVFDDFNYWILGDAFADAAIWEDIGWELTEDGTPTADTITVNNSGGSLEHDSCLRIFPGTDEDMGGQAQYDPTNASTPVADIAWHNGLTIPNSNTVPSGGGAAGTVLDNTTWVFACRIGLKASQATAATNWDSKAYIGWAASGDSSILTHDTGVITINSGGPLVGFHILLDGSIRGISHRTQTTAMAEGTNFTELISAGGVDSTVANGARTAGDTMWFDLALRMEVSDMSATANGTTEFFYRGPTNVTATNGGGRNQFDNPGQGYKPWIKHSTVLSNQTPNATASLVPTIEVINGPTAGVDGVFYLDWWAMGRSRIGT